MNEAIASNGDVFKVRDCDECGGIVIERYLTLAPGVREVAEHFGDEVNPLDEPHDTIDIPRELIAWFAEAIKARAGEGER